MWWAFVLLQPWLGIPAPVVVNLCLDAGPQCGVGSLGALIGLNMRFNPPCQVRNEISGLQARLSNLGFYTGPVDGIMSPETKASLRAFQKRKNLTESGDLDQATMDALKVAFGS